MSGVTTLTHESERSLSHSKQPFGGRATLGEVRRSLNRNRLFAFAAGQFVSGDEVLQELVESPARMEAKRSGRTPRRTAGRR
jgi:hypothetical protein